MKASDPRVSFRPRVRIWACAGIRHEGRSFAGPLHRERPLLGQRLRVERRHEVLLPHEGAPRPGDAEVGR